MDLELQELCDNLTVVVDKMDFINKLAIHLGKFQHYNFTWNLAYLLAPSRRKKHKPVLQQTLLFK